MQEAAPVKSMKGVSERVKMAGDKRGKAPGGVSITVLSMHAKQSSESRGQGYAEQLQR
jgi:hypothetical protein